MGKRDQSDYFICKHCGARVPTGAKSCRNCGSDDQSGWAEDAQWYGDDEAYDDFDEQEYRAREFPGEYQPSSATAWKQAVLAIIATVLILIMVYKMGLL